jgi:putative endonuclease
MWFVYILRCADGSFYVGETNDVDKRLADHNRGRGGKRTAARRPVRMVYAEELADRETALARERQLKRWSRAKKKALIAGDLVALKRL